MRNGTVNAMRHQNVLWCVGPVVALGLGAMPLTQAESLSAGTPTRIDVFTTAAYPVFALDRVVDAHSNFEVHSYALDAIYRLEDTLSQQLPADPVRAEPAVLERLQGLDKNTRHALEHSARSLVRAVQYGVDKYPAIVFDTEYVVYGVTDVSIALTLYRHWRAAETS